MSRYIKAIPVFFICDLLLPMLFQLGNMHDKSNNGVTKLMVRGLDRWGDGEQRIFGKKNKNKKIFKGINGNFSKKEQPIYLAAKIIKQMSLEPYLYCYNNIMITTIYMVL